MANTELFALALGLTAPWYVQDITFDAEAHRLDLDIDFHAGSKFTCPSCKRTGCGVYDTQKRTWRHLDFFQHQAYITARVPRTHCPACGVKLVDVPWARAGSGFTLLFEILALTLAQNMAIRPLARLLQIHTDSLWRILGHYVHDAVKTMSLTELEQVGIDEIAMKKGHHYLTVFGDLAQSRVVYLAEKRESTVIQQFHDFLTARGLDPAQITHFCLDMWPAYLKGLEDNFAGSTIVFDRYHLMAKANLAVDLVRRQEAKERKELKSTRYLWLKGQTKLSKKEKEQLESLSQLNLKTSRAKRIIDSLRLLWECKEYDQAQRFLKKWYFWATHSRLTPIKEFAKTVKAHWTGILNFFRSPITNGIIEGLNNKIKVAMRRAFGFKTYRYLTTIIICLVAGKLASLARY